MRESALYFSHMFQPFQMHLGSLFKASRTRGSCIGSFCFSSILVVILFSVPLAGRSQNMEVGPLVGGAYYIGDLNPGKHFLNTQLAYGALARINFDTRWAIKLAVTNGKVKGSSAQSSFLPDNSLQFESSVTDISAVCEFNFFSYFTGSKWNSISPYIYAGIGFFFFDPMSDGQKLREMGTEGQNVGYEGRKPYSTIGLGIPMGVGVKYSLSKAIGLCAFWEIHKTFTDYLDDVSSTYYLAGPTIDVGNPSQMLSDPTRNHQPGMQRGNPENNDWFAFFGVSVTYKFNLVSTRKCRDKKFN